MLSAASRSRLGVAPSALPCAPRWSARSVSTLISSSRSGGRPPRQARGVSASRRRQSARRGRGIALLRRGAPRSAAAPQSNTGGVCYRIGPMSEAAARPRHAPIALIAAAVLAFAALRVPLLAVPLERDEGEYAYIAQRMLAGEVPYRDAFDQKPPGVFAAYLLAFGTAGPTVVGIRLFLALWTAATAVALYALVRRLAGDLAAGFALLVFALASSDPSVLGFAANTENWMLLPLVLAAHAVLRGWLRGDRIS